jgi:beta-xylosidase
MPNGSSRYNGGAWAPSIRYFNGKFHITFFDLLGYFIICISDKPEGPYERIITHFGLFDAGMFFDDDGRLYFAHGSGAIFITELSPDFRSIVTPARQIYKSPTETLEGSHMYKRNGWYYICNAAGARTGREYVMRSKNIYGPYESRLMLNSAMNYAYNGLHQGGFLDLPNGDSWFFIFQDHDSVGRPPILFPIEWVDDWPVLKQDSTTTYGHVQPTYQKPATNVTVAPISPMHSDEFSSPTLSLEWQWSHNPDDTKWSLTERPGFMRLHATPGRILKEARNTLVKRLIGPSISGRTLIDLSNLEEGDVTGLAMWNLPYAYIGIRKQNGQLIPAMVNNDAVIEVAQPLVDNQIHIKVIVNDQSFASFYYSIDNEKTYIKLGNELQLFITVSTFLGSRFGFFCYHVGNGASGFADFDYLRLESQIGPANHFDASESVSISSYDTEYNTTLDRSFTNVQTLTPISSGAWACFNNLDFGQGANTFQVSAKAVPGQQGMIEIRRDRSDGELMGKCPIVDAQPEDFKFYNTTITSMTGVQKIYLVFTGGSGGFFTLANFKFFSQ